MSARHIAELLVLGAVWGGSYLFMRIAAPEFGPVALAGLRVAAAAAFLLPILAARGRIGDLMTRPGALALNGVINAGVPFLLITWAILSLSAGFAAILNATAPLFAAIVARAWLGEALSAVRVAGLLIGFTGVGILVWDESSLAAPGAPWAFAAALAGSFLYGVGANYTRRHLAGIDALTIAAGGQLGALAILAPLTFFAWPAEAPSPAAWGAVIVLGVVATGAAHIVYFRLIAQAGAAPAVAVAFLIPLFAMLWGALVLGEPVTPGMAAGAIVILAGTALTSGTVSLARRRGTRG